MNLRKRFFLMFTLIFVAVAIAACNANNIVTLAFSDDAYTVKVGDTVNPDVNIEAGSNYDANTIAKQLVFSSNNESVVKVVDGELLAVGIGDATIKVQWSEKAIVFTTAKVRVLTNVAPKVVLTDYSPNMLKGAEQTIKYEFDEKYTDATVRWESANEDVVTVDQNGKVTALAVGEATVIAYAVVGESEQSTVVKITVTESDFAINYVLDGGINDEGNPAGFNTLLLPVELKDPTKAGYKFEGWYLDSEFSQKVTSIVAGTAEDVTLYAKWSVADYNVTYVLDGGVNAEANPATVKMADSVTLQDASKEGFEFQGWYTEETFENKVEKLENVTSDVTLYAKFEEIVITDYAINYDLDGGRFDAEYYTVAEFEKDFLKDFNAQAGYDFTSAASLDTEYLGGTKFGNFFLDEAMFAKWSWMLKGIYAVAGGAETLDPTVADFTNNTVRAYYLCNINAYLTGTSHKDTYYEKQSFDFSDAEKQAVVTSYSEPKSGGAPKSYTAGVGLETLPTPIKDGFAFTGWVDGEGQEVTSIAATQKGEVNLKATWESAIGKEYAINYDLDGGKFDVEVEYYTVAEFEKDFIKDFNAQTGYDLDDAASLDTEYLGGTKFGNFFLDEAMFAKWSWMLKGIYAVAGGAETLDPAVADFTNNTVRAYYLCNINAYLTGTSHKDTYYEKQSFDFSDAEKQAVVTSYSEPKSGGVVASYVAGTGLETLPTPVKEGYIFAGWVDGEGNEVTAISATQTGEVNLKATWEEPSSEEFKINYELNGGYFLLPYVYQNHEEMVRDFVKDFNAFSGKTVTVTITDGHVTCDFFGRSWMADNSSLGYNFLTSADYSAKWGWMLDVINENRVARGKAALSSDDGQAEARGDVHNFLCLCAPGEFGGNASFGGDYSNYSFLTYASKLAKVEGVLEAPTSYKSGEETLIPDPVKEEYTFINWAGDAVATIETTGNGNFWSYYANRIFLYNSSSLNNPTFSFRVGLMLNSNGTYRVDRVAQSGASFTSAGLDAEIIISESYEGWAGTAAVRSAIKVGQTAVIDGSLATGVATVKFYDLEERPVALTYETTSNKDFWTTYTTGKFLFNPSNAQNPLYSYRVGIAKKLDGTYYVDRIGANGQAGVKYDGLAYIIVVSGSHTEYAAEEAKLKNVKVGQIVEFDGDPDSGACTVKFINNYTVIPADAEGDLNLNALFVQLKDENALSFNADGGKLSEGAPDMYLTSTGLDLANITASKDGYTFKGWLLDGKLITNIPAGKRGDLVLVASYEPIEYKIEYELNGGVFSVDSVEYIYADFASLVADFLADYEAKYGLTGLTSGNFFSKSNSYGLVGFFKDEALSAKWNWLVEFMLNYNSVYSGLNYMKNASSATNYNKYWRANLAAFMQKSKITSPLSMDFSNLDEAKFFEDNVPTKVVTVAANPVYVYTVDQLPLELAEPTKEGVTFVGWCDNEYLKREFTSLPAGTLGDVKLYAKWSDSVEGKEMKAIKYELNGGKLPENAPVEFEVGVGVELVAAEKNGFTFLGYTLTETGTEYVTSISKEELNDVKLYAQYQGNDYDIEYVLGDGSYTSTTTSYTVKLNGLGTSISTTKLAGYYANYKTDVMLFTNSTVPYLYADKIAVDVVDGLYQVVEVALAGKSLSKAYPLVITLHADYANYNDAAVQDFLKVEAGQLLIVTGLDLETGAATFEWAEKPTAKAELTTTSLGGYWTKYNTDFIVELNSKAGYTWADKIGMDKVGGAYIVKEVALAGKNLVDAHEVVVIVNSEHPDYATTADFRAAEVGALVEITGDLSTGNAVFTLYNLADTLETVVEETLEAPVKYNTAKLPVTLVAPYAPEGKKFVGFYFDEAFTGAAMKELPSGTYGNVKLYARYENEDWVEPVYHTITYNLDGGELENAPAQYEEGKGFTLPVPVKDGYKFLGWSIEEGSTEYVVSISETDTTDFVLYANWKELPSGPRNLYVGEGQDYPTIELAMADANDGDTIFLTAGQYAGATIDKQVAILGPNAGINPNLETRSEEAIVTSDLLIAADGVVIDGIQLTAKGRVITTKEKDVYGLKVTCILVDGSTVNDGNVSVNGPIYLAAGADTMVYDVEFSQSLIRNSASRPMIMFIEGVENLRIVDNVFDLARLNYNDGIKTNNDRACISGDVNISRNIFNNLAQYSVWFRGYGAGNYILTENEFNHIGTTGGYLHGAFTFVTYKGDVIEDVNILIQNNKVSDGLALLRIDNSDKLTADHTAIVKYNTLESCVGPEYINNKSKMTVICDSNYWGEATPADSKFVGVKERTNDLASADDVPSPDEVWFLDKITVGEGKDYATLTEALAAANDGDSIVVFPGTYDENVIVNKSVNIYGLNHGIAGAPDRLNEAVFIKSFTISANDVVIDGLRFEEKGNIILSDVSHIELLNFVMLADVTKVGSDSRSGQLVNTGALTDITIDGAYFSTGDKAVSGRNCIVFCDFVTTNLTIQNSYFGNEVVMENPNFYSDCIKVTKLAGEIIIRDCQLRFTTDNFNIFIGGVSNEATKILLQDNVFGGFESTANGTAGLAVRNLPANGQLDIIHNVMEHMNGTVLSFNGGKGYVSVLYNVFDENTELKNALADCNVTFVGNIYKKAPVSGNEPSDLNVVKDVEELEELYQAYLEEISKIKDTILNYELDGAYVAEELPEVHVYNEETKLPTPYKEGYKFLGWTIEEGSDKFITSIAPKVKDEELTLYANFAYMCILVGEGGTYATISDALKNAKEFDVIKVLPGTYDEDVVVDVNYIRIEGANAGVDYEGERGDESIVKSMKIVANSRNIIIDGFKFSNPECLQIEKANNINVLNSIFGATATADGTSMIYGVGSIDGLTVEGCLFTANNRTHYRAIRLEYSAAYFKNINILHNKFVNTADASTYIDCVKIADVTGDLNITANEFDWAGNNWTVFIGGGSLSESNVHISFNFNTFGSERDQNQSGATFRNLKADTTLDVIGNVFSKVGGNVLQTNIPANGVTAAYVTVRDNVFMDTSAKVGLNVLADNLVFENNYAFTDWTSSGSIDLSQFTNAETSDAALEDLDVYAIGYVVKPGALFTGFQDSCFKGSSVNVSKFIPTLSGYRFVGWHLKEDLSDDVVNYVNTEEDIVILYAEYEKLPVHTITYELDGGELAKPVTSVVDDCVLKLAEPTKFASTFLGWSLEKGSKEYVDKLTVTEDVTLYANWLNEVVYDVKLVLNGGSARYASRADIVEDFINDYNKLMGTNWATAADIPSGNFDPVKWHTFYGMELNAKQTVRDKWLWLAKYLLRVSSAQLASNNCNVTGLTHLVNNAAMSGDDIYGLLYAFRSFLQGGIARPDSSYTSVDFSVYENANSFWPELSEAEPTDRQFTATEKLPDAFLENYKFDGWYLNPEYTGEKVEHISGACTLYAKFVEENPVTEVTITNKITEIVKFNTLQLEWKLNPEEALIKNVRFTSSDESVATVDAFGLVTTLKEGTVTITVTSDSGSHPTDFVTFEVYSPKHFEVSYQTESYTTVGGELQLNAELIDRDGSKSELVWSTEDSSIVSVDQDGKVTALGKGMAKVTVADKNNGSFAYDFYVTVLDDELSDAVQAVVDAHNSNPFTRYDLGIGAGKPAYYRDIIGAVSDIMYNEDYEADMKYYVDGTGYETATFYEGPKSSVEWICIHYTGNMSKGATASANADYFHSGGGGTSINYVVGNDGIFHVIDDKYIAYHAGDGTTVPFEWFDAGIDYVAGDPQYAVPGIVKVEDKYYYTLNGKTSKVEVADWKATVTTNAQNSPTSAYHVFESDYANPKWFNDLGLPVKVENGKYYIGTTWWCYTQVLEGRICSRGGNRNSVGIESCVNPEADLWYTWQKLAQLTAYLMDKYDLDITRVKMHHFFSAKDCHQPFLANNCEIWWEFIDSVLAEYNRTYVLDNAKFEMTVNAEDQNIIDKFGRVTVPDYAKTIRYTVKVTVGDQVQEITLATAVNGIFAK